MERFTERERERRCLRDRKLGFIWEERDVVYRQMRREGRRGSRREGRLKRSGVEGTEEERGGGVR